MIKKLLFIFSILIIITAITAFIIVNNQNKETSLEIAKSNVLNNSIVNNIESKKTNEQVNEISNEIVNDVIEETTTLSESSESETIVTASNTNVQPKEEDKSTTKTETNTNPSNDNSSKASATINTPAPVEQETEPVVSEPEPEPEPEDTTPVEEPTQEETPQPSNARPELAYATYREVNTSVVPEIIRILNNEISTQDDLVAYGCKALAGNASEAKSKTSGFTYMLVSDIHKGKVAGNYTVFEQRVRNNVGGFANYNVYAEDEYTYDGQGLNPKWSQTLVWIYLTF